MDEVTRHVLQERLRILLEDMEVHQWELKMWEQEAAALDKVLRGAAD